MSADSFAASSLPIISTACVQWSPSKISPPKRVPKADDVTEMQTLLAALQDIDRQRTFLLNKAQRRCASTSSLSPQNKPRKTSPLSMVDRRLEQHRLATPAWDKAFPEDLTMCDACGKDVYVRTLKLHRDLECPLRLVKCQLCGVQYKANGQRDHDRDLCVVGRQRTKWLQLQADELQDICCLACAAIVAVRALSAHLNLDCVKRLVSCPNANLGCPRKDIPFDQLHDHEARECVVGKQREALLEASRTSNALVECDWCNRMVVKRHMLDHKEDECLMRERQCPNTHLGCREWVPVGDVDKHIKTACVVTLERHALAQHAQLKEALVVCRDCGAKVKARKLGLHQGASCVARLVPCVNAIHGCQAMLKHRDRHIHEHVDITPESRPTVRFASRNGHIRVGGGEDLKPPWCAEFWVWLLPKEDDVLYLMEEALRWQETIVETTPRLKSWQEKMKDLQTKLKLAKGRGGGGVAEAMKGMESEALAIEEGVSGCKAVIREARARVKSLVGDAATLLDTIQDESECETVESDVRRQAAQIQPTWAEEDLDVWGSVRRWQKALSESKEEEENVQHVKLLAKRMQLLKGIEERQKKDKDPRETARFLKQAKKELARVDDKLSKCVDVPLSLVQPALGFHTIASSTTSGIHLVMASTGSPGLHSFDKRAHFQADLPRARWVHVAFNATALSVVLFVDAVKADEAKGTFQLPMECIGADEKAFRGYLQEVRYWSETRSKDDLTHAMHEVLDPTATLRGYWTFEEGLGDFVDDMACRIPRSPCFHTEWIHYSIEIMQLLGDPPTPSFRQRNMCQVVTRRNFLASKHHARQTKLKCALGCGLECTSIPPHESFHPFRHSNLLFSTVEARLLERHHKLECPERTVLCRYSRLLTACG
ncbi:Aste57867_18496 [Aphanomyces stellatus]|uniref:Aste57867_18496 protein n=1 Tax=Aphanomyces stellatus TaxID=120398 RepID=A0A485LAH1_9STRA|nr:hypothetical protein As57867_018434 [Aphanomyces stellatus]VFT95232.1 Aste57867_18496 [Aphanomyces stellatus]